MVFLPKKRNNIVYGPWKSRRIGYSLGINLNPSIYKTCNFDCVYCEFGETVNKPSSISIDWLNSDYIENVLEIRLERLKKRDWKLDSITFSGNGEPTLHPEIRNLVFETKKLRDKYYPEVPLSILTNSSLIGSKKIFETLKEFDYIFAKLDVGSQKSFRYINRPVFSMKLNKIVKNLCKLQKYTGKVILQTLIFKSSKSDKIDNSNPEESNNLIEKINLISPLCVYVYTVNRYTSEHYVAPANYSLLKSIVCTINTKMGKKSSKVIT
jgi:wyosine [tRNA(Phe)-imidazoG37] synthetase (radical SAM superfamily)